MGKKIAVGMGNHLIKNDEVRRRIIEQMQKLNKDFETEGIAENGLRLFKYFNLETEKIVIIDSAIKRKKTAKVMVYSPDQVLAQKTRRHISTHEIDILKTINLGKKLLFPIPEIKIVVVEPDQADNAYTQNKMEEVIKQIIEELS